jgi:predicted DNA-binding transcriptional regulator AlpA
MQHQQEPEAVDERRAAEIVGLKPATLKKYRMRGGGPPYVRYGRRAVRYRVADLRAWRDAKVIAHTGAAT